MDTMANNRYYYRNKITNQIQWEYPEGDEGEKKEAHAATNSDESGSKVRSKGTDDHHKSRGSSSSRHRKREEKDKNKYEKRNSSHHYRRKRRRGRDQSNSSDTSRESQHRHHRKSKKKKRRRSERSPSIEIVEDSADNIDGVEILEMTDAPNSTSQTASPSSVTASDIPDSSTAEPAAATTATASIEPDVASQAVDGDPIQSPPREDDNAEALGLESPVEVNNEETLSSVVNPAVISKPPQIIIHPQQIAALHLNIQTPDDLHAALSETTTAAQASLFQPYPALPATEQAQHTVEVVNESSTVPETDKKKKKKEKKSLATGSSIMMKKKHMSSMVQKWEKVKIEVEREDRAKELRQAAIRKKIEELKSSDK